MERQVRAQYTADYKAQAVSLAESLGAAKAARKLGISVKTLAKWIRLARDGGVVKDGKRRPVSDLEAEVARLRAENTQLRMERDFIKKAAAYFAKGMRLKYAMMKTLHEDYPMPVMCRIYEVSMSGYYAWLNRPPSKRAQEDARLELEIRAAHQRTRETFGPERLKDNLDKRGVNTTVYKVKALRTKLGIRCKKIRKFKATTNSNHEMPVAPNLLKQKFTASAPNQIWLTDITYIQTDEGWLYLAGHKDILAAIWWAMR